MLPWCQSIVSHCSLGCLSLLFTRSLVSSNILRKYTSSEGKKLLHNLCNWVRHMKDHARQKGDLLVTFTTWDNLVGHPSFFTNFLLFLLLVLITEVSFSVHICCHSVYTWNRSTGVCSCSSLLTFRFVYTAHPLLPTLCQEAFHDFHKLLTSILFFIQS